MFNLVPARRHRDIPAKLNNIFNEPFFRMFEEDFALGRRDWNPAVEVNETEDEIQFSVELPGISREDISIDVENGVLTFSGEKKSESEKKEDHSVRSERWYGKFSRSFRLPEVVDADKIKANLKDGVLHISVPKKEEAKPRRVEVKVV